jgi:hypothetical protein
MNKLINKLNDNKIPDRLQDKTTVYYNQNKKYHPLKNYLGCIILRIILGLLIFYNLLNPIFIYILSSLILIIFLNKYIQNENNWKVYPRTILVYSLLPIFTKFKKDHNYGGLLVIIDSLMGLQSRHIQNNLLN